MSPGPWLAIFPPAVGVVAVAAFVVRQPHRQGVSQVKQISLQLTNLSKVLTVPFFLTWQLTIQLVNVPASKFELTSVHSHKVTVVHGSISVSRCKSMYLAQLVAGGLWLM